jgi:hypothetical protein
MIEQRDNQLVMTFANEQQAISFKNYLETLMALVKVANLLEPGTSAPSSELLQGSSQQPPSPPTAPPLPSDPPHSRHTVLTPERQDALARQRELGLTSRQRLLRAQTTLRDGTLPFSRPTDQPPPPSSQESPRIRAARQGGFADGAPAAGPIARPAARLADQPEQARRGSRLRPVPPSPKT